MINLQLGDCLDVLKTLADNSVDSVVTDPPYGLSFMGKHWDYDVPGSDVWAECLRVLKPGGHLLAFAGTRTQHRMAVRIEDAGFEIRDMIAWVYGSGFPKSLDVSKAIDKIGGVDTALFKQELSRAVVDSGMSRSAIDAACGFTMRFDTPYEKDPGNWGSSLPSPEKWEVIASVLCVDAQRWQGLVDRVWRGRAGKAVDNDEKRSFGQHYERNEKTEAVMETAQQWQGFGTALKPALEPVTVARKPLVGTVAANVLAHGCGVLNIDASRIPVDPTVDDPRLGGAGTWSSDKMAKNVYEGGYAGDRVGSSTLGRWPANIIHDGSDEVVALFPESKGQQGDVRGTETSRTGDENTNCYGEYGRVPAAKRGDTGSSARFFYCAKTSKKDRGEGNAHPTVKPTDLMRYLCRLVTPPGGIVLDPFMGSGSTGKAAVLEGFRFIGIEREPSYMEIATARIDAALVAELW